MAEKLRKIGFVLRRTVAVNSLIVSSHTHKHFIHVHKKHSHDYQPTKKYGN